METENTLASTQEEKKEIYPGITQGMVENFLNGDGYFYDPSYQKKEQSSDNYHRLSEVLKGDGVTFSSVMQQLGVEDKSKMTELTEKAYYNSDAFALRAARSLGYDNVDEMTPEHREVYDKIIQIGKDSSTHLFVSDQRDEYPVFINFGAAQQGGSEHEREQVKEVYEDLIYEDRYPGWDALERIDGFAFHDSESELKLGVDILGHEMGHYLYNQQTGITPGKNKEEERYGISDSPLNRINSRKISISPEYQHLLVSKAAETIAESEKVDVSKVLKGAKAHDNSGIERGADVHGARMLMFQEGIFNPFSGNEITPEQVETFKKAHPESRIFQYWNNGKVQYNINNIAQHDSNRAIDENMRSVSFNLRGEDKSLQLSSKDYDKLMALDTAHQLRFISSMMPENNIATLSDKEKTSLTSSLQESLYGGVADKIGKRGGDVQAPQQNAERVDVSNANALAQSSYEQIMNEQQSQSQEQKRSGGISMA